MGKSALPNEPANGRPNILFILTDDQPAWSIYPHTSSTGRLHDGMEKLRWRFSAGVDLTKKAYCAVPLCGPDRVSLLTGQYPHMHGVTENDNSHRKYRSRGYPTTDLLSRLDRAGYRVGFFGKFINGYGMPDDPYNPQWIHPYADRWVAQASGQHTPYRVNVDGDLREVEQNATPYFGERAEWFINDGENSNVPWFCYLNWTDPHVPYTAPDAWRDEYGDTERHTSPGVREDDLSDKSAYTRAKAGYDAGKLQERYEGSGEEIEMLDSWVKRLFTVLARTGQLDNTIVIFSTDNGYMTGEHGMTSKGHPHEESSRVPLLIRGPGVVEDLRGELLSNLDITRTIVEAARADVTGLAGRDILSYRDGDPWRERVLVEHPGSNWAMVREGNMVYIDFGPNGEELYDLEADPYQLESLDSRAAYATVKQDLATKLRALRSAQSGYELRAAES